MPPGFKTAVLAEGLACVCMPCAQVDNGDPCFRFRVVESDVAVASPHFILGCFLRIAKACFDLLTIGLVELARKRSIRGAKYNSSARVAPQREYMDGYSLSTGAGRFSKPP